MDGMTIGQLARRCATTAKTLRYYERIGLLATPRRTRSGYRSYDERHAERVDFIRKAKRLGLSLAQISRLIALADGGTRPCAYVGAALDEHIAQVARSIAELTRFRDELIALRDLPMQDGAQLCPVVEHGSDHVRPPAALPLAFTLTRRRASA